MMTWGVKGKNQTELSDIHLQSLKLGGSTQKTSRKLCQAVVVEPPGEAGSQTAVQDCVFHSLTKTRLVWEICMLYMYIQYTQDLSMQASAVMQAKSLIVTLWCHMASLIFYIPASMRDDYHVLHTAEGAMDCRCSWSLDWKEPVSQVTSCNTMKLR